MKSSEKVWKSAKKCEKVPRRFCPLVVALEFFFDGPMKGEGTLASRGPLLDLGDYHGCPAKLGGCFGNPNPYNLSKQYGSTPPICTAVRPPICIAVLSWLLSFEERETLQYASHLYCSTPPICTRSTPPICTAVLLERGHRKISESFCMKQQDNIFQVRACTASVLAGSTLHCQISLYPSGNASQSFTMLWVYLQSPT